MSRKAKKGDTIRIANPEPGGRLYTSSKEAQELVERGRARPLLHTTPPSIYILPEVHFQALCKEAKERQAEEALLGKDSEWEWRPRQSGLRSEGKVKVWQATRGRGKRGRNGAESE